MANNRYSQVKAKRVTKGLAAGAIGGGGSSITTYDSTTDLPLSGVSAGDQAFVTGSNRMYVSNGTGWYSVSLVNTNPSITSVQDSDGGSTPFTLATDGSATVITITASDPEDVPLTYGYSVTSGSLTNGGGTTATVVQGTDSDVNKFTITPSSTEAYEGTFELTFTASDGINQGTNANSFTLQFITIVANSKYTTLLAAAVDTSDNNNITDASSNNHTITAGGDAHAGTFSPYRSGGYSGLFDSTSVVQLSFAGSSDFEFGSANFTIEMWFKWNSSSKPDTTIFSNRISGSTFTTGGYFLKLMPGDITTGGIEFAFDCGSRYRLNCVDNLTADDAFFDEGWHHYAAVRNGTSLKLFVDGQEVDEITLPANETNFGNSSVNIGLGINNGVSSPSGPDGEYRDVRIVKGVAITPPSGGPTETLDAVSGTTFLLYNGEGYVKDKTSNHSPTYGSTAPTITATSPYDYDEYSATDHGGAINFDGTGDYLTIPDHSSLNFASNDWTIECWIYPRTNVGDCGIWHQSASGGTDWFSLYLDGSFNPKFVLRNNNAEEWAGTAAANTAPQNTWTHIALVRRFGTDIKLYANGKVVHTETQHLNVALENKTYNHVIGYERFVGNGTYFDGLISDFKMDIGTAHYTAEFTPPTAPLSSTASDLHIKGTDASIIDKSQSANLKLVDNTTGSTTQVKFANTKSMYFDGTGDNIRFDTISLEGNFTLEYWLKLSTYNADAGIFGDTGATNFQQRINHNGTFGKIMLYDDGYVHQTTNCFTQSEAEDWMHIAYSRQNGSFKLYVNGVQKESITSSTVINVNILGAGGYLGGNDHLNGYIQDFRITKGLARYTANFTPPTASLEG